MPSPEVDIGDADAPDGADGGAEVLPRDDESALLAAAAQPLDTAEEEAAAQRLQGHARMRLSLIHI